MESNFLKKKYDLHNSPEVESAVEHEERKTGEKLPNDPEVKIEAYLDRLQNIIEPSKLEGHPNFDRKERNLELVKGMLHKNFVIKPEEIPEAYFENQKKILREQGHGDVDISEEQRAQLTEVIIADQESSLDKWIDYLASEDATYPNWLKYYAIRSILGIGDFDKEKKQFSKRSKGTTKPFPDLNREALAYVLDVLEKKYKGENIDFSKLETEDQTKLQQLLQSENFGKLYAFAIEKVTPESKESLENTKGKWIKYDQNSDHMPLVESLQGHGTGWCTAGESTAQSQLKKGDFYVYYSEDKYGNPTIPRVAIRMNGNQIGEVRGVAKEQNLDPYIGDIVKGKLKEFPDGAQYEKKSQDMKRLTEIEKKIKTKQELNTEDLRFVYEIDAPIEGFGYQRDPRIIEILSRRYGFERRDIAEAMDILPEEVSLTDKEAMRGGIKFHYGYLDLASNSFLAEGLEFPKIIGGDLILSNLVSAEGLKLPEVVNGDLELNYIASAEGLKLPETVRGTLDLRRLASAEGLEFPKTIGGDLILHNLVSAEGLKLPEIVNGSLNLYSLTSAEGLKLPEIVNGSLFLDELTSAEGLKLPKTIGGDLNLVSLASAKGLKLPEKMNYSVNLNSLTSAEGLVLPEVVSGNLFLGNLISAEGIKLPKTISGYLELNSLTSAEGLVLPEVVGGFLNLSNLTYAKGLILPKNVGGGFDLRRLTSAEGITFPEEIGDYVYLNNLDYAEMQRLINKYPALRGKIL